jgi:inner membrane protein
VDDVSHALFGLAIAQAGPAKKWGRPAAWALVLSSLVPDVDGVIGLWGRTAYIIHHRGFTHALIGWIPTALAVALPVWWLSGRKNFRPLLALSMAGVAGHVLCDTINAFGVMPLYPFSLKRWQLDWVFIVDVVFTAILLVAVIAARKLRSAVPARAGLATLVSYVALCGVLHAVALRRVERAATLLGWRDARVAALPAFPWAAKWEGFVVSPDGIHEVGINFLGSERVFHLETLSADDRRKLEASPDGRAFLWFARVPAVCHCENRRVVYDARFSKVPWRDGHAFAVGWSGDGEARWER